MEFEEISDKKMTFGYTLTCPFCSAKYPVMKTITFAEGGAEHSYNYISPDSYRSISSNGGCGHLILWENEDEGIEFSEKLEFFTRMADIPFRVWDIFNEVINNDDLPEGCDVQIRAFYGYGYIVYIFCNDPDTLEKVVLEKTKEHIQKYYDKYGLSERDLERYVEILKLDGAQLAKNPKTSR